MMCLGQARPDNMAPMALLATNIMEARGDAEGEARCGALQDYGSQPTCEPMQDSILLAIADPARAAAGETHSHGRLWWQYAGPQRQACRALGQWLGGEEHPHGKHPCGGESVARSLAVTGAKSLYDSLKREVGAKEPQVAVAVVACTMQAHRPWSATNMHHPRSISAALRRFGSVHVCPACGRAAYQHTSADKSGDSKLRRPTAHPFARQCLRLHLEGSEVVQRNGQDVPQDHRDRHGGVDKSREGSGWRWEH